MTRVAGRTSQGIRWSFLATMGRQGLRLVAMLALARLIGPYALGVVTLAMVYMALVGTLREGGVGAPLVQMRSVERDDEATVTLLSLAITGATGLATILVAPALADYFGTPELSLVLQVLVISGLLQALMVSPQAMLSRELRFKALALAELVSGAIATAACIGIAAAGGTYSSYLVLQVGGDILMWLFLLWAVRRQPLRGSRAALKRVWGYGTQAFGAQLVNYVMRNADNIIIGRALGAQQLGFYTLSYRTMMLPVANLGQVTNRVAMPTWSRLRDDTRTIGVHYLRATRLIAILSFPFMALCAASAPVLIPGLLGAEWEPAVLPLQILAVTGARQSVQTMIGSIMLARGRAGTLLKWGLFEGVLQIGAFLVGVRWGIVGVATAFTLVGFAIAPIGLHLAGRMVHVSLCDYARQLGPGLALAALAAAFWYSSSLAFSTVAPSTGAALLGVAVAMVASVVVLAKVWPSELSSLRSMTGLGRAVSSSPAPG